jgi:signal transduction histidine kinase
MIRLFSYSLSLRLLAIFLLLGAVCAWGAAEGIRWAYGAGDLRTLISGHLALHVDYVRRDIGAPPRIDRALAITRRVPVDIHIEGPGIRWSSDPRFPDPATLKFGPSDYFSDRPGALLDRLDGVDFATRENHNFLRFNEGEYTIVVVTPKIATRRDPPPLVPILVGLALFAIAAAYFAVRWLFRPLVPIREGAAYIGAGHFEHRIEPRRDDELGALAADINSMAAKVQGMLDAKRQLLLGVSHELRTPLSRINLGLELLDDTPPVRALRQDAAEMREVVETLLQAERLGSQHVALDRRPITLESLAQTLRTQFFPGEPRLRIEVGGRVENAFDHVDDATAVLLDEARVLLMLKNLVGNALRYSSPDDGPVHLSMAATPGGVEFRVRDRGPGIPPEMRAHLGEPFFRPDASRARETGGTGLGLYLAFQVAAAHGGRLELVDADGPGALFVATLPNEAAARS